MYYMSFLNFSEEVSSDLTLGEKLNQILTTGIGGYILVFVILALIWFILALFGKIFDKKTKIKKVEAVSPVTEPTPSVPAHVEQDDKAIVAAIVAAISAYEGKPTSAFKVVSFRKKH